MTRPTVVVYDQLDYLDWVYTIEEEALTAAGVRLLVPPRAEAREALPEADVVIVHDGPFSTAEFALLRDPVGIVCYSVGMDQVDAARPPPPASRSGTCRRGRRRSSPSTPSPCSSPRCGLPVQDRAARTRQWDHRRLIAELGIELFSLQTVGIVGAGRIGRAFATRARALGFETIAYDPRTNPDEPGLAFVTFDDLLAQSRRDRHLRAVERWHARPLRSRDPGPDAAGSVLVNVSRGPIVVDDALAARCARAISHSLRSTSASTSRPSSRSAARRAEPALTPHTAWVAAASHRAYHEEAAQVSIELLRDAGRPP